MDKIYCETHKCTISVSGCILRQKRNGGNPQQWMYNKVPGDPRCADCEQGKAVKKGKYKPYKEDVMNKPEAIRTCRICNESFPETKEYFYTHNSTKDGWDTRCKECVKKIVAQKKEEGEPTEPVKVELKKPAYRIESLPADSIVIDFSDHVDLLEKLTAMASAEFRTPELQLMAMIAKEA